jgi:hypothetical protein
MVQCLAPLRVYDVFLEGVLFHPEFMQPPFGAPLQHVGDGGDHGYTIQQQTKSGLLGCQHAATAD